MTLGLKIVGFVDWTNWTVGVWVQPARSRPGDPLGQRGVAVLCLGPLCLAFGWPA